MGRLRAKTDYEDLRKARILENQARLATLGVQKTVSELKSITSSTKSQKTHVRKWCKVDYSSTPLRRSSRLQEKSCNSEPTRERLGYLRRSSRLQEKSCNSEPTTKRLGYLRRSSRLQEKSCDSEPTRKGGLFKDSDGKDEKEKRPGNAPFVRVEKGLTPRFSPEALARRCTSKGRGSLYDPIYGICCHFCRQKKLCGEEDCKRCGNLDIDQPCIGKTDCSICHSSNGVLCRGCLKVRYGEELEEVWANKQWTCPHCIEEKGNRPYWICNSSLCLTKRKMVPTGIAIYTAREKGYKSVAHLLMDKLQQADTQKR